MYFSILPYLRCHSMTTHNKREKMLQPSQENPSHLPSLPSIDGSPPPLLAAPTEGGGRVFGPMLGAVVGSLKLEFSQR
jgi:hypothetical protein